MSIQDIPFLGAYLQKKQMNEEAGDREMQRVAQAMSLKGILQKQQQEASFRRDIEALGPEPTQEALTAVASRYSDPKTLLAQHQSSLDRRAAAGERALQFAQTLDVRQQQLELAKQQFEQRTSDVAERRRFEELYKTESQRHRQAMDALNVQLRLQGLEIQKQGNALQLQRFDAAAREREEREIEGGIAKAQNHLKDVMPVYTAARQLNDRLTQYTPDTVPGVGYLKNTDWGKLFLTQEGKDIASSQKLLGNSILKAMSGAAVTVPEEVRQMAAMMADGRFSAPDFYIAFPKVIDWVNDQVALGSAGLNPKARERFVERTGIKLDRLSPRFNFDPAAGVLKDSRAPTPSAGSAVPPPPPGFHIVTPEGGR